VRIGEASQFAGLQVMPVDGLRQSSRFDVQGVSQQPFLGADSRPPACGWQAVVWLVLLYTPGICGGDTQAESQRNMD
jgi:hypothetical protein